MIPPLAELPAPPQRIILHWTGGAHTPNQVDRAAYHFIIDGRGEAHAGDVPVAANLRSIPRSAPPGSYAAHTKGLNSFSVGISFAAMAGARDGGPYGSAPLLEEQVRRGMEFVARCCRAWGLRPDDERQLLTHAEVERVYGARQAGKWDIAVLPWSGMRGPKAVGNWLRSQVAAEMAAADEPAEEDEDPPLPFLEPDLTPARGGTVTVEVPPAPPATLWQRVLRIFRGG